MKYIEPWKGYLEAFKIWEGLYFVGTEPASSHIIDTGQGLIMIDSGYQHSLYSVIDGIYSVGLNVHDLKYILHTHGHIDHFGATRALVELTGAKTAIGELDKKYATGELDLSYAKELEMDYIETFEPDILLKDGDVITLGNTTITSVATPGHTPGAMSYFFNVGNGEKEYRVALMGGVGTNTMCKEYLDKYDLSYELRKKFLEVMDRLKNENVDIFLGNHTIHNNTVGKYQEICEGNKGAFINPDAWREHCIWAKNTLLEKIEKEEI